MTEKQENILQAALNLFAKEGYNATSTSKIAKAAGVSEGLIFRHFKSKEGLLEAVLAQGAERAKAVIIDIVLETNPKEVVRKTLMTPFKIPTEEFDFWRLQYKLKWEINFNSKAAKAPLEMALRNAFEQLGAANPAFEAAFCLYYFEGVSTAILKNEFDANLEQFKQFLFNKYSL